MIKQGGVFDNREEAHELARELEAKNYRTYVCNLRNSTCYAVARSLDHAAGLAARHLGMNVELASEPTVGVPRTDAEMDAFIEAMPPEVQRKFLKRLTR